MKMNAATLEALKGSIEKWEKIINNQAEDCGPINCPLCQCFLDDECIKCPVLFVTGTDGCRGTPYEQWYNHHEKNGNGGKFIIFDAESRRLAKAELDFLKSLLPKEKDKKEPPA